MARTWHYGQGGERSNPCRIGDIYCGFRQPGRTVWVTNVSTPTSSKSFWDSMWSPGSKGCILAENMCFDIFASVHIARIAQPGILDSGGLAAIFARLDWTSLSDAFCRRNPKQRLTLIWTPYVRLSVSCRIHLQDLPLILPLPASRC